MSPTIRLARATDAAECGRICFQAFSAIADAHHFARDVPDIDTGIGLISMLLANPGIRGLVAEVGGRIVGSNFIDERDSVLGVGPITVDPAAQNEVIGRHLMQAAIARLEETGSAGVRLVQAGYHCRSLSLYSKLGFEVREHLSCMQGNAMRGSIPGCSVRRATEADIGACNAVAARNHGHHRGGELRDAIRHGTATVVERGGRITGYATQIAFFAHANAETNDDLKALILAAPAYAGPGFLLPSRNAELLRWCLEGGLRITQPMTLMTMGLYGEPQGAWLPSVTY